MKGQSVNVDWTVGLALFLVSVLSGVAIFVSAHGGSTAGSNVPEDISIIESRMEDELSVRGVRVPVISVEDSELSDVPIDRSYSFREGFSGSGAIKNQISNISLEENKVIGVLDLDRDTSLIYLDGEVSDMDEEGSTDLDHGSEEFSNSKVDVGFGGDGLTSLKINDVELLSSDGANLGSGDFSIEEYDTHSRESETGLTIYKNSAELILKDPSEALFSFRGFKEFYWDGEDKMNISEESEGVLKSGETEGFVLANESEGVSFAENLEAEVSKKNDSSIEVEVFEGDKIRLRLLEDGLGSGKEHIDVVARGIVFGAEEDFTAAKDTSIESLNNMDDRSFESLIGLSDYSYNISLISDSQVLERGSELPDQTDVVVSERSFLKIDSEGNFTEIDSRVSLWH